MRQSNNSEKVAVNVVGSSTFGRYAKISSEKTYNMFISDNWLVNFAGYRRLMDILPSGEGRGIFHSTRGNLLIVVVGSSVYALDTALRKTFIGTLATTTGEVFMDENLASQICIVDGVKAYIYNYNLAPMLTPQTLSGSLIPNYVTYHNTFFLFGNADTSTSGATWYAYSRASDTTISQTTQMALQTKPDYALAIVRLPGQGNNVLVMGSTVSEVFTQVGGTINYRRNSTFNIDYGCRSVSTIATSDKYVMWLASNESNSPVLMVASNQGAERLSTDGIDYLLGQIQFPAQSTAMFYRQDGHLFYQITFYNPADNLTLAYDFNTQKFYNLSDEFLNYHPARDVVYFGLSTLFISLNNASIYGYSTNYTTINENLPGLNDPTLIHEMQRIRITNTIRQEDNSRRVANWFGLTMEQGCDPDVSTISLLNNLDNLITEDLFFPPDNQIVTEDGVLMVDEDSGGGIGAGNIPPPYQPRVDMSFSKDGGETWSNTVARELNPIGYRKNILNWQNLGLYNELTLKLRFWGTYRFVVYEGFIERKP